MPTLDLVHVQNPVRNVLFNAFDGEVTIRYRQSEGWSVKLENLTFDQVLKLADLVRHEI